MAIAGISNAEMDAQNIRLRNQSDAAATTSDEADYERAQAQAKAARRAKLEGIKQQLIGQQIDEGHASQQAKKTVGAEGQRAPAHGLGDAVALSGKASQELKDRALELAAKARAAAPASTSASPNASARAEGAQAGLGSSAVPNAAATHFEAAGLAIQRLLQAHPGLGSDAISQMGKLLAQAPELLVQLEQAGFLHQPGADKGAQRLFIARHLALWVADPKGAQGLQQQFAGQPKVQSQVQGQPKLESKQKASERPAQEGRRKAWGGKAQTKTEAKASPKNVTAAADEGEDSLVARFGKATLAEGSAGEDGHSADSHHKHAANKSNRGAQAFARFGRNAALALREGAQAAGGGKATLHPGHGPARAQGMDKISQTMAKVSRSTTPKAQKAVAKSLLEADMDEADLAELQAKSAETADTVEGFLASESIAKLDVESRSAALEIVADDPELAPDVEEMAGKLAKRGVDREGQLRAFQNVLNNGASPVRGMVAASHAVLGPDGKDLQRPADVSRALSFLTKRGQEKSAPDAKKAVADAAALAFPSTLPAPPDLEGLQGADRQIVLQAYRGKVQLHYSRITRYFKAAKKKIEHAQYREDLREFAALEDPQPLDTSGLPSDETRLLQSLHDKAMAQTKAVRQILRRQSRTVGRKRRPASLRHSKATQGRAAQLQKLPRTFVTTPNMADIGPAKTLGAEGLQAWGSPVDGGRFADRLHTLMTTLAAGPVSSEGMRKLAGLAQEIGEQAAKQAVQGVMDAAVAAIQQGQASAAASPQGDQAGASSSVLPPSAKVDGWGIARHQEAKELGAGIGHKAVRAPGSLLGKASKSKQQTYTGRRLVNDESQVRQLDALWASAWKDLSHGETALLRNLGFERKGWEARSRGQELWPNRLISRRFDALSSLEQEALKQLGIQEGSWNVRADAHRRRLEEEKSVAAPAGEDEMLQVAGSSKSSGG